MSPAFKAARLFALCMGVAHVLAFVVLIVAAIALTGCATPPPPPPPKTTFETCMHVVAGDIVYGRLQAAHFCQEHYP